MGAREVGIPERGIIVVNKTTNWSIEFILKRKDLAVGSA